jgi:hypothetical protein
MLKYIILCTSPYFTLDPKQQNKVLKLLNFFHYSTSDNLSKESTSMTFNFGSKLI